MRRSQPVGLGWLGASVVLLAPILLLAPSAPGAAAFNIDTDNALIQTSKQSGSYFGYTVSLFRDRATPYLLVGAPRAQTNQPDTKQAGAVYKCTVDRSDSCQPFIMDNNGSGTFKLANRRIQVEDKSHQAFGATLHAAPGDSGAFVVCAPQYIYLPPNITHRDPVGSCYLSRGAFSGIAEYSPCRVNGSWGHHNRGYCQAGFSAAVSKDGRLYVGSPGAHFWQGQVYSNNFTLDHELSTPLVNPVSEDDQYLGYSLALGNFYPGNSRQDDVAVGVPRGAELDGKVIIMNSNMRYLQNLTGEQAGSYFGYSLTVADINGDKLDDLLVGAPLYFNQSKGSPMEHGRIYLYVQDSYNKLRLVQRIDGPSSRARFGSAIANCGDLNRDGFQDVAVGAPFGGTNGHGAVYIYMGHREGLSASPDQVINAESLPDGGAFRSFGFSLSGGLDMDGNHYPDLLVGDYKADRAVLLRARPIVALGSSITFQPDHLNLDEKKCKLPGNDSSVSCLTVEYCTNYTGMDVDNQLDFGVNITLDAGREPGAGRLFFLRDGEPKHESQETLRLTRSKQQCRNFRAYITRTIRDKLAPIKVEIEYNLKEGGSSGLTSGPIRPLRPVMNKALPSKISRVVSIYKNCSGGSVCIPDLRLRLASNLSEYDMGSDEELVVDVMVKNAGDDAFETTFYLTMPLTVNYIKVNSSRQDYITCSDPKPDQTGVNLLKCDLGNPLPQNKELRFSVRTKPVVGPHTGSDLLFVANVNSTNAERDTRHMDDNHAVLDIPILVDVRVAVSGSSVPNSVTHNMTQYLVYGDNTIEKPSKTRPKQEVQHTYLIQNKGPLRIKDIAVVILWPSYDSDGADLLKLSEEPQPSNLKVKCKPRLGGGGAGASSDTSTTGVDQQVFDTHSNCGMAKCERIDCNIFGLERNEAVTITMKSQLQERTLNKVKQLNYYIYSKIIAQVKELPYNFTLPNKSPAVAQVTTQVIASGVMQDYLPWWNILLAILLGIFLLLLLVCFLRYMGFFARKRPPKAAEREPLTPSIWNDYNYSPGDTAL